MKKLFLALSVVALLFTACKKEEPKPNTEGSKTTKIEYNQKDWFYVSLSEGKVLGQAVDGKEGINAEWAKRTDWDLAVNSYNIRTNGGTSSTVKSVGGIFANAPEVKFADVKNIPANATYELDKIKESRLPHGKETFKSSQSKAEVSTMEMKDGKHTMPPVWLKTPVYVVKSADGKKFYKVEFSKFTMGRGFTGSFTITSAEIK